MYRDKLLEKQPKWILNYTSSMIDDREIAVEVINVLEVHVKHLIEKQLIPKSDGEEILNALKKLEKDPSILFSVDAEDVHEAIEIILKDKVGRSAGWISLGRSRNDHVATALRIHMRKLIFELMREIINFRRTLIDKAKRHTDTFMPMFTHLQPAQPSVFAHYLLYIEEEISTHFDVLKNVLIGLVDRSPLGSAAGVGTIVPIDRNWVALKLGFNDLAYNTLYATCSRSFLNIPASIATNLMVFLSRIAEDFIVMCTPQFNYFNPDKTHLATSSIMPQKRNLATLEILRARAGECIGFLSNLLCIIKGLPSGYNLDLQEASRNAWKILHYAIDALRIIGDFISKLEVNFEILEREVNKYLMQTASLAEYISMKYGIPHREAHQIVAEAIKKYNDFKSILNYLSGKLNVKIDFPINAKEIINLINVSGSPNKLRILEMIGKAEYKVNEDERWLKYYFEK